MAVGEALVHVKNAFLLFRLLVCLSLSGWPLTGHSQYHHTPEVVIPLKVTDTGKEIRTPGWLSYSLNFGGQRHIVHMKAKKFLVSKNLPVFTYTDQGTLIEDQPFVQDDCYYQGYVEGDTKSLVALNTCFGSFQGMLQINGIAYDIKPKVLSTTFEHLVYKLESEEVQSQPRCGLTEEEISQQLKLERIVNPTLMQSSFEVDWVHQWFLELAIVVDHGRFVFRGQNISNVQLEVIMAINLVDTFYEVVGLNVILTGLEIWNKGNPYKADTTRKMMYGFCTWKEQSFNSRVKHDAAHIIIKQDICNEKPFTSYYKGICNIKKNCGLECILHDELLPLATAVAHELGHNLWMPDDDVTTCVCGRPKCIMNKDVRAAEVFSNCSIAAFFNIINNSTCLHVAPYSEDIFRKERCGNGVLETGEQCDCGSTKLCAKDPCCLQNCTLKPGADCALGLCCKNCKFRPSGTVCREKDNECDLPEWCNGTSPTCPDDVYVEDGTFCMFGGICYGRRCNSHNGQCKEIFGSESKSANQSCYMDINTRGNRFGHCGITNGTYVPCKASDVLCGRIQCENVKKIPLLKDHTTIHWTQVKGFICWGTDYHFGMNTSDIGDVKDGTECGTKYMCLKRKCIRKPVWKHACLPNTCNRRGICNNKHHCHCEEDWAPPHCLKAGDGGSVDSGPPPKRRNQRWTYLLILITILPSLLLCICFIIFFIKKEICDESIEEEAPDVKTLPVEKENIEISPGKEKSSVRFLSAKMKPSFQISTKKQKQRSRQSTKKEKSFRTLSVKEKPNVQIPTMTENQDVKTASVKEEQTVEISPEN